MPQHKILVGDGAGRYLPFARNHLRALRKRMSVHAYSNTVRVQDARIQVRWDGDQEHIHILAAGSPVFGMSIDESEVITLAKFPGGASRQKSFFQDDDMELDPDENRFFLSAPVIPVGNRRAFTTEGIVTDANPFGDFVYRVFDTMDGGVTKRLRLTLGASDGFMFCSYGGPTFDNDGKIVGTRYLIAATSGVGGEPVLIYSENTGENWLSRNMNFGPAPGPTVGFRLSPPVAIGRNRLMAMAGNADAHDDTDVVLIRSTNGGANWSVLPATGLAFDLNEAGLFPTFFTQRGVGDFIALAKNKVLFFVFANTRIRGPGPGDDTPAALRSYTSLDGGESWSAYTEAILHEPGDGPLSSSLFTPPLALGADTAVVRFTPNSSSPFGETVMVRTLDSGATWEKLPPIVPGTPPDQFGFPTVYSAASDQTKCVLMMPIFNVDATFLYFSTDSGETWQKGGKLMDGDVITTNTQFHHLGSPSRPQPANIGVKGRFTPD